jgi:hypothetical protein
MAMLLSQEYQNHWSERERAESVGDADALSRPRRSFLSFDAVKNAALRALLLLLAFARLSLCAGELQLFPSFPLYGDRPATGQDTVIPLAPRSNLFSDFGSRLEEGIENRNLIAIQALYQTKAVTAKELELELARWRRVLSNDSNAKVLVQFKELSTLPPKARQIWSEQAHRLTRHGATHLAFVTSGAEVRLILPLVAVENRLLIVPSDKVNARSSIESSNRDEPRPP